MGSATASTLPVLSGKRVAIVHRTLELGGSERQSLHLARCLRQSGAVVCFIGLGGTGALADLCDQEGFPWHEIPISWFPGRLRRLQEVLSFAAAVRRLRAEVLLPYTALPNTLCGLVWRGVGARYCAWGVRGHEEPFSKLEPLALRWTPRLITNSAHIAARMAQRYPAAAPRIVIVPNGVQLDAPARDRFSWRRELCGGDDSFLVTMLAAMKTGKGHEIVLRAWRRVLDASPDGGKRVLCLAGRPGDQAANVKALAFDLDLSGRAVRFLGHVGDVSGLLAASDLAVFASESEGVPNAVLEPMSAGLMVVASDEPGVREALGPGLGHCLAPPGDASALAALMVDAMGRPDLRSELGLRNARRVRAEFSVEKMCEMTTRVIVQGLLSSGRV